MADTNANTSKDKVAKAVHNDAGLERIKEVLLGEEMEGVGRRLADIDLRVQQAFAVMQDTLNKRLETLEAYVKREFTAVSERIKNERTERKAADNEFSTAMELVESEQAEVRRELLEESRKIVADYLAQLRTLSQTVERSLGELHRNKLDRSQLSRTLDRIIQEIGREEGPKVPIGKAS
jgi:hypothetical protein